jgi:hypothetical protein
MSRPPHPQGTEPVPTHKRPGGPRGRSRRVRMKNLLPPPGYEPRNVHPVASGYNDWAIDSPTPAIASEKWWCVCILTVDTAEFSYFPWKMDKLMSVGTTCSTSEGWRNSVTTEDKHVSLHPSGSETPVERVCFIVWSEQTFQGILSFVCMCYMSFFICFKMHTLSGRKRSPTIQTQSGTLSHLELNVAKSTKDDLNFVEACLQRML